MKLIVGLGNPGIEYKETRHNVGFMVLDEYLKNQSMLTKFNADYCKIDDAIFIKPLTYMNLSGEAVKKFKDYFKILEDDILIIHDDLDLPIGSAKIKFNSSSGGDNGIKSIIKCLNTQKFAQYKIGIGRPTYGDTVNYVLGKFTSDEKIKLTPQIEKTREVIDYFINNDINSVMNKYNGLLK